MYRVSEVKFDRARTTSAASIHQNTFPNGVFISGRLIDLFACDDELVVVLVLVFSMSLSESGVHQILAKDRVRQ